MKIIDISKEQFLSLLLNSNPYDQGQFGIITLINDELYKVYYKDFIDTYISKDKNRLDLEADISLQVEKETDFGLKIPSRKLESFSRLLETKSSDLITGVLSYKGLFVGIKMKYYDGYVTLSEAVEIVLEEEIDKYISTSYDLVNDLMMHNIVPRDISENNILVNTKTSDVKLIDLDGNETIYGPLNYVNDFPYNIEIIKRRFNEMIHRLKTKNQKKYSKKR